MTSKNYSRQQVLNAIKEVKKFPITVTRQNHHRTIVWKVKDLYWEMMEINRYLFNPENEYNFKNYNLTVEDYKNNTKKEMDKKLRLCRMYLLKQLASMLPLSEYC